MRRPQPGSLLLPYLALGLLALIWGASFLFIKVADEDMSAAMLVLTRSVSGLLTLGLVFAATRQSPIPAGTGRRLPTYLVMGVFGSLLPWAGFAFGELYISSALASIINATTPLWTAIFAYWVTPAERPSPLNYLGVGIGLAGTVVLLAPQLYGQPLRVTTLGTLAVIGAAASYSVAALFQRRRLRGVSPVLAGFWQLATASALSLPLAVPSLATTHLHLASLASVLALGIFGSGLAYLLYYYMLNTLGATRATTVTFLLPVTALIWGVSILHESVTLPMLAGMLIILSGVFLTSRRRTTPAAARARTENQGVA